MRTGNERRKGSYWKIAKQREKEKCVFCDLREKYVIARVEGMVLTVNLFPYIDGQLIVLPERHIERYEELTDAEVITAHNLTKKGAGILHTELGVGNLWFILRDGDVSGKTVKHLHWNLMPYTDGLNTWHFQKITIPPLDLAVRLKNSLDEK